MEASTAAPATPGKSFADVWMITLGHAMTHWYPATFYVLLPLIGKELGLSYSQIGLVGFFMYAIRPVLQAWLLDATPKNMGGTSIGVLFGMQAAGSSIGPVTGGMLADRYGIMSTFWFLAGAIVVANLFIFLIPVGQAGLAPSGASLS